jgi:tRNA dimethylallyltransferase
MNKNIIIIAGPTASGKTDIGIRLAKAIDGEIISADSMQIYKYMNIGTAKPTLDEREGIPHHMIDVVFPDQEFSVALFRKLAGEYIDDIINRGKVPIVLGGTGLYINSLTYSLDFTEASEDKEYRTFLMDLADQEGKEYVHSMLRERDPEAYERLFPNDLKRVIRALEVYKATGKTISQSQRESKERPIEYNPAYFALTMDRKRLYDRINLRVDKMFDSGLIEEVKMLRNMGYSRELTSMQGIGYKEVFDYLDKSMTLEEIKSIIKQSTRRYAKRQLTWFRREYRIKWIDLDKLDTIEEIIQNIINFTEGVFNKL